MLDRVVGVAFALLAAACAIYLAVRLIDAVALPLAVIAAVVFVGTLIALAMRGMWRANRW